MVVSRPVVSGDQSPGRAAKPPGWAKRSGPGGRRSDPGLGWVAETNHPDLGPATMTDDRTALRPMVEPGADATFPREMIGLAMKHRDIRDRPACKARAAPTTASQTDVG